MESADREFPVRFLLAAVLYELKQNESLQMFYQLLQEQKKKITKLQRQQPSVPEKKSNWTVWDNVDVEIHELFGAFPRKDDCQAKYIMVTFEICRVHTRLQDYRNAYKIITQCVKMFPNNPYVLSKAGRLCLETGRRREA